MQEIYSISDIENRHHSDLHFTEKDTVQYPIRYFYSPYTPELAETLELYHPSGGNPPKPVKAPSTDKNINTLNFPLFFFWHRLKNMHEDGRYSALFGGLLGNILQNETLLTSVKINLLMVLGGLDSFEKAKANILDSLDWEEAKKTEVFSDQVYGIGTSNGLAKWMELIQNMTNGKAYFSTLKDLSEYFSVSLNDISTIQRFIVKGINSATGALDNLLNCLDNKCDSLFIFKKQTATSFVSKSLLGPNTLCDNKNLFFTVEYSAFYEDNFLKLGEAYADLYWTDAQTDLFYNVDSQKLRPNSTWNVLPHYSNLSDLRTACKTFWNDNLSAEDKKLSYSKKSEKVGNMEFAKKNYSAFVDIIPRFTFKNPQQVEVTCGYIEHVYVNMVLEDDSGTFELFLLNQLTAENLEKVLANLRKLSDKIVHLSFTAFTLQKNPTITCDQIISQDSSISADLKKSICDKYNTGDKEDITTFVSDLYDNCEHDSPTTSFGFKELQRQNFCTSRSGQTLSYISLLNALYLELKTVYDFGTDSFSLTKLAMLQMVKSTLSKTANPYLNSDDYPTGFTVHPWDPETFPRPFEMAFFVDKFTLNSDFLDSLTLKNLTQMLNKASLFNPLVLHYTVVHARNGNFDFFNKFMGLDDKHYDSFWQYIVLFLREFYLQGFYMKTSESELVNGIEVPFIRDIKEREILLGGDPSTMHPVSIRLQKADYVFEKYTGKEDISRVDNFYGMNGFEKITNDMPIFNGNVTSVYRSNPWEADIPMRGCDNFCHESESFLTPQFTDDSKRNIGVYGPPLNRTIEYNWSRSSKVPFMNCNYDHYELNQFQYEPKFKEYHQDTVKGFFNMTSVFNFPIVISQDHLYGVDEKIANKYSYFEKEGKAIVPNQYEDGGFYRTEQRTKAVVEMNLNLHFNLEITDSLLFVGVEKELDPIRPEEGMPFVVPLYNLEFWTNLPEKGWKSIFGKVSTANSFLDKFFAIFVSLFIIFFVIFVLFVVLFRREVNQTKKDDEYEKISTEDESVSKNNE